MAKKRKSKQTGELFAIIVKDDEGENVTLSTGTMSFLRRPLRVAATAAKASPGTVKKVKGLPVGIQLIESADYSAEAAEAEDF